MSLRWLKATRNDVPSANGTFCLIVKYPYVLVKVVQLVSWYLQRLEVVRNQQSCCEGCSLRLLLVESVETKVQGK